MNGEELGSLFHLPGEFGLGFGIPTTAHAIALAHNLGWIADQEKVFAFSRKVARDLAAAGYNRSVGEDGSLSECAAVADEDIVANADGQLAGMNSTCVEIG